MREDLSYGAGERVSYTYKHWLNGTSYTLVTKHGYFERYIPHGAKHWQREGARQECFVLFDGNKKPSRVEVRQLKRV